jgi:hypothetical protein
MRKSDLLFPTLNSTPGQTCDQKDKIIFPWSFFCLN